MFQTENIAILLATYQGEDFLREQIDSILKQSYEKWELFIHDDGSKDKTVLILQEYIKKYPHKMHLLDGPKTGGAKSNFMYLLNNVSAPYLMFCDQDDVWLENKIDLTFQTMLDMEDNRPYKPVLVFTELQIVDQDLNTIAERMSKYQQLNPKRIRYKDLIIQNVISGCTVMINHALQLRVLECVNPDAIIMHDWWCALVAAYFGSVAFIESPLILYRQHGNNSVGAKKIIDLHYILEKMKEQKKAKESLIETRNQAALFLQTFSLQNSLLEKYSQLSNYNKIKRLSFYVRNGIWKCGFFRNIGLIIWG